MNKGSEQLEITVYPITEQSSFVSQLTLCHHQYFRVAEA